MNQAQTRCLRCGSAVTVAERCSVCGTRFGGKPCPACAKSVDVRARFCDGCGTGFPHDDAALAPVPGQGVAPWVASTSGVAPAHWLPSPPGPGGRSPIAWAPRGHLTGYVPPSPPRAGSRPAVAALRGIGVALVLGVTLFGAMAAGGYAAGEAPRWAGRIGLGIVLLWASCWLGGTIWLSAKTSWAWGVAYLLAAPITLPVYVFRSSLLGYPSRRPRFPALWTFVGIVVVAAAFAATGLMSRQQVADVRTPYSPIDVADIAAGTPVPAGGAASYDPFAMWAALLSEPIRPDEWPGEAEPEPWSDFEDVEELDWYGLRVYQDSDLGVTEFAVLETDAIALDWFASNTGGHAYLLPGRPEHEARLMRGEEGDVSIQVLVGNVVVYVDVYSVELNAADNVDVTPEQAAEKLAAAAVGRVLRIGGEPHRDPKRYV